MKLGTRTIDRLGDQVRSCKPAHDQRQRLRSPPKSALLVAVAVVLLLAAGCTAMLRLAQHEPVPELFVVNALNHTVSIVNPKSGQILKVVPLDSLDPHSIAYLPSRGKVYVVDTGLGQLSVLDAKTGRLIRNVLTLPFGKKGHQGVSPTQSCIGCHSYPVGGMPIDLTSSPKEDRLYVANLYAHNISVFDTATDELLGTIATPQEVLGLGLIGGEMWVTNRHDSSVSVVDMATRQVVATMPVGQLPGFVLTRPSHDEVYVCVSGEGKVMVFDAKTRRLKWTIPTQLGTRAVAFDEAAGLGYAANYYSDSVTQFELATGKVVRTVKFTLNPDDVVLSKDDSALYVSCTGTGKLVVADPVTLRTLREFPAGPYPAGIAVIR
ncbi:MAG: YncE family protein [Cyanobacteria bacterium REEB65]|nr:YncE family protein [Cyanobacteria bacterium REEB65]